MRFTLTKTRSIPDSLTSPERRSATWPCAPSTIESLRVISCITCLSMAARVPAGELSAAGQRGEVASRKRHEKPVALIENAGDVAVFDMRMSNRHVVSLADLQDVAHQPQQLSMVVLPGNAQLLGEVALADEQDADPGHLTYDLLEVVDRLRVLDHQDDEDLALRVERPDVGLAVIGLLAESPVAGRRHRRIAAQPGRR